MWEETMFTKQRGIRDKICVKCREKKQRRHATPSAWRLNRVVERLEAQGIRAEKTELLTVFLVSNPVFSICVALWHNKLT